MHTGASIRGQLSSAVGEKLTTAEHCPGSLLTEIGFGQFKLGGWLSMTVTVNEQEAVRPFVPVAVQVTVVVPTLKVEPDSLVQETVAPVQASFVVTA